MPCAVCNTAYVPVRADLSWTVAVVWRSVFPIKIWKKEIVPADTMAFETKVLLRTGVCVREREIIHYNCPLTPILTLILTEIILKPLNQVLALQQSSDVMRTSEKSPLFW